MPFHFTDDAIVTTFRQRFPDKNTPTVARLEQWDNTLRNAWEGPLSNVLPEFPDIDASDREVVSKILVLAFFSAGDNRREQVRSACTFFEHIESLGLPTED